MFVCKHRTSPRTSPRTAWGGKAEDSGAHPTLHQPSRRVLERQRGSHRSDGSRVTRRAGAAVADPNEAIRRRSRAKAARPRVFAALLTVRGLRRPALAEIELGARGYPSSGMARHMIRKVSPRDGGRSPEDPGADECLTPMDRE